MNRQGSLMSLKDGKRPSLVNESSNKMGKKQPSLRLGRAGSIRSNIAEPDEMQALTSFPTAVQAPQVSPQTQTEGNSGPTRHLVRRDSVGGRFPAGRRNSMGGGGMDSHRPPRRGSVGRRGSMGSMCSSGSRRSVTAKLAAKAIDERITDNQNDYVNDLMRNTAKKLPASSYTSPRRVYPATVSPPSSSEDNIAKISGRVPSGPPLRTKSWGSNVEASRVNMNPREFARAIDARVESDVASYTNDLIHHTGGKQQARRNNARYGRKPRNLVPRAIPETNDFIVLEEDEEEMVINALNNSQCDFSDMHSVANSSITSCSWMDNNDPFSIDDDQSIILAQDQQEREMVELAMEMSRSSEMDRQSRAMENRRLAGLEQEMFELAMERSMADIDG